MVTASSVDEFLAGVPADKRVALENVRMRIRQLAPDAVELINYGVPAFKLDGRPFVSYGAAKGHCTLYVQSPAVIEAFAADLAGFRLSKGSVQLSPEHPIPDDLIRRLVEARTTEIRSPLSRQ